MTQKGIEKKMEVRMQSYNCDSEYNSGQVNLPLERANQVYSGINSPGS